MLARTGRGVTVVVLLVVLGAVVTEPACGALYVCGSDTLLVDPVGSWEAVVVHLEDGSFLLQQTVAASGVRYSDGERTFWTKGDEAFLEVGGVVTKDGCRLVRRAEEDPQLAAQLLDLPVLSYEVVDVAAFNERIRTASGEGETWPLDAARTAIECVGGLGGRVAALVKADDAGEGATASTVTVICDGFYDDSVRGTWNELRLVRTDTGAWEIEQACRAYRCWRGPHAKSYGAALCP